MPAILPTHNQPEYSVSEISSALKRVVEDTFGYVRVRGEISGFKRAASGHLYLDLKDDKAVLNAACWKGNAQRLSFKPEDGLEVICTGKLSTYPGRSNYQLIIESMEPAGLGALMALLEKRKKELAAEGLFDPARKKPIPYLPRTIGIITSPTGAVIRDILHRLADRFPVHVLVWPVLVQGEGAAEQVAAAIRGFNSFTEGGALPRPDVLIVARGGGSIEDLWAFNEEIVVRAAAASVIPLISAVGHETDTTLIDYASDKRAPTPTAAAEMAVPVREELQQTCDDLAARLQQALRMVVARKADRFNGLLRGLTNPKAKLDAAQLQLSGWQERLARALPQWLAQREQKITLLASRMDGRALLRVMSHKQEILSHHEKRMLPVIQKMLQGRLQQLAYASGMLQALDYRATLKRGFVLVKDAGGQLVTSAGAVQPAGKLTLQFHDGVQQVTAGGTVAKPIKGSPEPSKQSSLFEA